MTDPDAGHLLPDAEWLAVVADAELQALRIAASPAVRGYGTGAPVGLSGAVTAARHGGGRPAPTFGVLHSAETPLAPGYAAAIARMFATTTVDKSAHYMVDPAETWGVLDDLLTAWHCGTGNTNSIGVEQAGYARFTRAEWTTPAGLAQLERVAAVMRACRDRYGIGLYWMTDAQLLAAHRRQIVGGWATHDQCRRVLGGTTHTDPEPNYPRDLLMARAIGEDELDMATLERVEQLLEQLVGTDPDKNGADRLGDVFYQDRVNAGKVLTELAGLRAELAGLRADLGKLAAPVVGTVTMAPADREGIVTDVLNGLRGRLES